MWVRLCVIVIMFDYIMCHFDYMWLLLLAIDILYALYYVLFILCVIWIMYDLYYVLFRVCMI